jgi:hypothetical protein
MENKTNSNSDYTQQIYLKPKKNPQIRIGSSYQVNITNETETEHNLEQNIHHHANNFNHQNPNGKNENYKSHQTNTNINVNNLNNENDENDKDDFVKPGKKRRIDK